VILVIVYTTQRWRILIYTNKRNVSLGTLMKLNFVGCYFNIFLPSSFGGDIFRIGYLNKKIKSLSVSTSSVFLDRFLGISSLFILAVISLIYRLLFENHVELSIIYFVAVCIGCFIAFWIFLINLNTILNTISSKSRHLNKMTNKFKTFSSLINLKYLPHRTLMNGLLISTIGNILSILSLYFITLSLGIQVGIIPLLIVFPLVTIVSMIPISIGGIGLREGAFTFFLSIYSVASSDAIAISILFYFLVISLGIVGGFLFALSKSITLNKEDIYIAPN